MDTENRFFRAQIAGAELTWRFRFADTERYLRRWLIGPAEESDDAVSVSEEEYLAWSKSGNSIDAFSEFCLLCEQSSEYLLTRKRCIFHAAAVRFRDKAWLIAAGSGVGKTTQCRNLLELWPEKISVINGDKPALEALEDGTILVHPSPWTGKEGLHGASAAPLGGLILLSRGERNEILPVKPEIAVPRTFMYVFQSWRDEKILRLCGSMTERIVRVAPAWIMTSCEVPDSTRLLYEVMEKGDLRNGI